MEVACRFWRKRKGSNWLENRRVRVARHVLGNVAPLVDREILFQAGVVQSPSARRRERGLARVMGSKLFFPIATCSVLDLMIALTWVAKSESTSTDRLPGAKCAVQ